MPRWAFAVPLTGSISATLFVFCRYELLGTCSDARTSEPMVVSDMEPLYISIFEEKRMMIFGTFVLIIPHLVRSQKL